MVQEHEAQVLSREELFKAAWDRPLDAVAGDFGLTPQELRKICDRHDIPIPSRGYWDQVAAGKRFARPTLRPPRKPDLEEVRFVGQRRPAEQGEPNRQVAEQGSAAVVASKPTRSPRSSASKAREPIPQTSGSNPRKTKASSPAIDRNDAGAGVGKGDEPTPNRTRLDPAVRQWIDKNASDRRDARRNGWGRGMYPDLDLPIQQRRLQLYSQLFALLRAAGFAVTPGHTLDQRSKVRKREHDVEVHIYERRTKHRRPLTDAERRDPWTRDKPSIEQLQPSGELVLKLNGSFYYEVVSDFRDARDLALEEQLGTILENIEAAIVESIARGEARERERQAAWKAEQERWRRKQEAEARAALRAELVQQASDWRDATLIREFLSAVRATRPLTSGLEKWLTWAQSEADEIDPINGALKSPVSEGF